MPCIFCIAALAVAASTLLPAMLDNMQAQLQALAPDLVRRLDTESTVQWHGTFAFTAEDGSRQAATADVTIYKASRRARIQVHTHELPRADVERLENAIAGALGATIVSRHSAHESHVVGQLAGPESVPVQPELMPRDRTDRAH